MACAGGSTVSSKLAVGVKDRLESLVDNVKIVKKQMKTTVQLSSSRHYGNFSIQHYWSDLISHVTMVSNWCTKLAVFFSKPPATKLEECAPVIHAIENCVLTMVSSYYGLPPSQGATLGKQLQEVILDILTGVESLVVTIIRRGYDCQFERVKETGSVWNSCDKISSLSKDNRAAVLRVFITNLQLLQDACNEAEQIITDKDCMDDLEKALSGSRLTNDDDDVDQDDNYVDQDDVNIALSDDDKHLIQNSIELIKMCPKCIANISRAVTKYGNTVTCHGIEQLDAAATVVMTISPWYDTTISQLYHMISRDSVDDLVTTLYPPITMATFVQSATELKDKLLNFLEKCSNFDFCKMAEFVKLDDIKKEILKTLEQIIVK